MSLPSSVVLAKKPDGFFSRNYPLTVGNEYPVKGERGDCFLIEPDTSGDLVSVHRSRFESNCLKS